MREAVLRWQKNLKCSTWKVTVVIENIGQKVFSDVRPEFMTIYDYNHMISETRRELRGNNDF